MYKLAVSECTCLIVVEWNRLPRFESSPTLRKNSVKEHDNEELVQAILHDYYILSDLKDVSEFSCKM